MIAIRQSSASADNPAFKEAARKTAKERNRNWIERNLPDEDLTGRILLIGGTDLTSFRLRVAQSHARSDLTPSHWSHVAIIGGPCGPAATLRSDWTLHEAPLEPAGGIDAVAASNGVREGKLSQYDSAARFPNMACVQFPLAEPPEKDRDKTPAARLAAAVRQFRSQRAVVDVPGLMVKWLGFAWGVGAAANPLLKGLGIPSSAFVEAVFAMLGVELTPGLASGSSCPEAIWQAAKWWHDLYKKEHLGVGEPTGVYCLGQPEAAIVEAK